MPYSVARLGLGTGGAFSKRWSCRVSDVSGDFCGDWSPLKASEGPRLRNDREGLNELKLPISSRGRVAAADKEGFGR